MRGGKTQVFEEAEAVVVEEEEMVMVKWNWSDVIQDVLEYERKSCRVFGRIENSFKNPTSHLRISVAD